MPFGYNKLSFSPAGLFYALFLALFAAGSLTACAPLAEQTGPVQESLPRPPEIKPSPRIFEQSGKSVEPPAETTEFAPEISEQPVLILPLSPEINELAQVNPWEILPLIATGEETEAYDFPVTMNEQVEYYLNFFSNRHRKTFARWLARSSRYLPMIKEEFAKAGLPLDLAYLPMIESGFNTTATSRASAVGAWQFMRATGQDYGLAVNKYVDERRDPVKSTKAAAAYLAKLYKDFDSWHLAVAAYNAGEGRIKKAMKQSDQDDFWEIAKSQYIHPETKLYVPQLIAAIMIAKDPEKYGFTDIEYEDPLEYETVHVPRGTPIKAVAVACNLPDEKILALNRHLHKAITPPTEPDYPLRVPPGTRDLVTQNLPKVRRVTVTEFNIHEVGRGETLTTISKKYKLSKTALLKANNLEHERLSLGQRIRIPVQTSGYRISDEPVQLEKASNSNLPLFPIRSEPQIHLPAAKEVVAANNKKNKKKAKAGATGKAKTGAAKTKDRKASPKAAKKEAGKPTEKKPAKTSGKKDAAPGEKTKKQAPAAKPGNKPSRNQGEKGKGETKNTGKEKKK